MKIVMALRVVALAILWPGAAAWATDEVPLLGPETPFLGRYSVDSVDSTLAITVDLNGDVPLGTYVTARFQNNAPRQRLANGFWVPWDERTESLTDTGFEATADGTLTFPIVDESLAGRFLPIVFTVSYQYEGGLKSGYIVIDP